MDNAMIGKIEKARRYAEEKEERVTFESFTVTIKGDNGTHTISYKNGQFFSEGPIFKAHGYSAHTMAVERLLRGMIPSPAKTETSEAYVLDSTRISKIEKAKRYAEERDRFEFQSFVVTIRGNNTVHTVRYENGKFDMDDEFFKTHGYSAHTMAMERILKGMIPSPAESEA